MNHSKISLDPNDPHLISGPRADGEIVTYSFKRLHRAAERTGHTTLTEATLPNGEVVTITVRVSHSGDSCKCSNGASRVEQRNSYRDNIADQIIETGDVKIFAILSLWEKMAPQSALAIEAPVVSVPASVVRVARMNGAANFARQNQGQRISKNPGNCLSAEERRFKNLMDSNAFGEDK